MPARNQAASWYVASVFVAGFAAVVWAGTRAAFVPVLLVAVSMAIAEWFMVRVRDDLGLSLSNIVTLFAIVVVGPEEAVVATLGVVPVVLLRVSDMRVTRTLFNAGQLAISASAAAVAYEAVLVLGAAPFPSGIGLLAVAFASIAYALINYALVSGVISLSSPDGFWATLLTALPPSLVQVPSSVALAALAALLWLQSPWAVLFIAIPVLVARYALTTFDQLDTAYDELVRGFVTAIEMKDEYTRGHSERVSRLSELVAEDLGLPYDQRRLTRYAALLHDVGKVGVPLCIINKAGPLTDEEFAEIQKHPTIGAEILRDIDFLAPAIDIVRFHHERLDGRGYPHGVGDEELSDIVRIVTAVDAFDAMTSTRSYRKALSVEDALAELRRCAGRQFDPRMVEALARAVDKVGWEPTIEFASEAHLHGQEIPLGTAQERMASSATDRSELSS